MPAPEAFWTVIGVAVSVDSSTALYAGEIFKVALEFFVEGFRFNNDFASFPKPERLIVSALNQRMVYIITWFPKTLATAAQRHHHPPLRLWCHPD